MGKYVNSKGEYLSEPQGDAVKIDGLTGHLAKYYEICVYNGGNNAVGVVSHLNSAPSEATILWAIEKYKGGYAEVKTYYSPIVDL